MTPCREYAVEHGQRAALDLWHHSGNGLAAQRIHATAKALCETCPVKAQCLAAAFRYEGGTPYRYGIFGGLDSDERTLYATGRPSAAARDLARVRHNALAVKAQGPRRAERRAELEATRKARTA